MLDQFLSNRTFHDSIIFVSAWNFFPFWCLGAFLSKFWAAIWVFDRSLRYISYELRKKIGTRFLMGHCAVRLFTILPISFWEGVVLIERPKSLRRSCPINGFNQFDFTVDSALGLFHSLLENYVRICFRESIGSLKKIRCWSLILFVTQNACV